MWSGPREGRSVGNELGSADRLRKQARGMALFSALCLAFAFLLYLVYRFRRPDGPNEHLLFVLVLVPLNFAFTGFVTACVHFRRARRSALSDKPEP
jgi:predicted permease